MGPIILKLVQPSNENENKVKIKITSNKKNFECLHESLGSNEVFDQTVHGC